MGVCIYVNLLFVIYFLYSFGYCFGYFQWNVQPKTIVCPGDDAHLVWNYTTNETASIFLWQKLGSQNTLVARIFSGVFSVHTSYTGRVTQSYLGNAAIAISSVNTSDSGTYGCTIQTVNSENVTLIVAEQPSRMPYFNKTDNSLTCNPPQKLGSPPVETKLKLLPGETVSSTLTTTKHGTYQCCISGEAVRCLASLDSTVTEFCVNETLDLETTTTTTNPPEKGLSTVEVIGIVIGVLVLILIVVVVFVYVCKHKKKACPKAPSGFSLADKGTKSVKLTWNRGFNGGHVQTFVIRYTNTVTCETKETKIKETNQESSYTKLIDGLKPNTTYNFWIYSTNEKGDSTPSDKLIVQTLKGNTYDNEDFASNPIQNPLSITNTTTKPPVKLQPLATKDKNHTPLDNTEEQNRKKKKKKQKQAHNKDETKVVHSDSENTRRKQDDTTGTMNENHQPYGNDDMQVTKATHGKQETLTIFNVNNEKNKTGIPYEKHETLTAIHIDNKKNKTGIAYEKHEKPTAIHIDNENNKIGIFYEKHEKLTAIHIDNENNKTGIAYEKHDKPTAINIDNGKI